VFDHHLLPLLRQDQLDELPYQRIDWLVGILVDAEKEEAGQRIGAVVDVLGGRRHRAGAILRGEGKWVHTGSAITHSAVADSIAIFGDTLHHRRGARLLLDFVLVVTVSERVLLEKAIGAGGGVAAVQTDRLGSPVAGDSELTPRRDRLRGSEFSGLGKD